jgi:leucyl aminopeptidase
MKIVVQGHDAKNLAVDLLVVPVFEDVKKLAGVGADLDRALGGLISGMRDQDRVEGKEGDFSVLRTLGKIGADRVCLLGAGKRPLNSAGARRLTAVAVAKARALHARSVAVAVPESRSASLTGVGQAMAEGAMLGDYRFLKYKGEDLKKHSEKAIEAVHLLPAGGRKDAASLEKGAAAGIVFAQATMLARGLVNEPASEMTPDKLVETAKAIAAADPKRLSIKVFDVDALKKMGAGGILAVGKGSDDPPYMIHLAYKPPKKAKRRIVLVGKGITFDSGGLSLKPSQNMEDMKIDMAGAAAVLAVMSALSAISCQAEVHGIAGLCENMPSGRAYRPGDIVATMSGKTIEVLNTDAEGRVTLADTLHYGAKLEPDFMIDLATLTGACMVALGQEVAGMMTNDEKLGDRLLASARNAGELLWRLPLVDEYRPLMKSHFADLKNISGSSYGGAITAGLFLEEFVGKVPWAHLDIAGPAWAEKDTVPHQPKGATGFGVRTVLQFLQNI